MTDTAHTIAYDSSAPADERFDAQAELQKSYMPTSSDLIPARDLAPILDWVQQGYEAMELEKSLQGNKVIQFPSRAAREKEPGMQSVKLDNQTVGMLGMYYERPSAFQFDSLRSLVDETPILSAVLFTRINQMKRFCRPQENGRGPGFEIRLLDRETNVGASEKEAIKLLTGFFKNCGWESNPRARARLRRDDFTSFMARAVRDTLTMDSLGIETEYKRDKQRGMDGFYCVDGATIRLCTESGYNGDDEIRAIQLVSGQIRTAYTFDDLIYVPRNPRSDILVGGYGMSETERLIKIITSLINAMTYNAKYFDSNAIPKGLLHLSGDYSEKDLNTFKRQWNAMVKGVNNSWALPVMVSKDQESKASFEHFGVEVDEMMFSKWMVFLTSIVCAVYGIGPDEINFESFSAKSGGLNSGNDTEEKLANSKDKGLRPLMAYFENLFSDFIVADFSDKFVFRWTGLDPEDEQQAFERKKLTMTVNEMRAENNQPKADGKWGDAPLNPSLVGVWQQEAMPQQEDYGQPDQGDDQGDDGGANGNDFGDGDGQDFGDGDGDEEQPQPDEQQQPEGGDDLAKSFGLPVFRINP